MCSSSSTLSSSKASENSQLLLLLCSSSSLLCFLVLQDTLTLSLKNSLPSLPLSLKQLPNGSSPTAPHRKMVPQTRICPPPRIFSHSSAHHLSQFPPPTLFGFLLPQVFFFFFFQSSALQNFSPSPLQNPLENKAPLLSLSLSLSLRTPSKTCCPLQRLSLQLQKTTSYPQQTLTRKIKKPFPCRVSPPGWFKKSPRKPKVAQKESPTPTAQNGVYSIFKFQYILYSSAALLFLCNSSRRIDVFYFEMSSTMRI